MKAETAFSRVWYFIPQGQTTIASVGQFNQASIISPKSLVLFVEDKSLERQNKFIFLLIDFYFN
jgi:hypothetical protein